MLGKDYIMGIAGRKRKAMRLILNLVISSQETICVLSEYFSSFGFC